MTETPNMNVPSTKAVKSRLEQAINNDQPIKGMKGFIRFARSGYTTRDVEVGTFYVHVICQGFVANLKSIDIVVVPVSGRGELHTRLAEWIDDIDQVDQEITLNQKQNS